MAPSTDWGRVLDWEPPTRLRYLWHLFFAPLEATEVELTFTAVPAGTAVRLEQRGWEHAGGGGAATPAADGAGVAPAHRHVRARVRGSARARGGHGLRWLRREAVSSRCA